MQAAVASEAADPFTLNVKRLESDITVETPDPLAVTYKNIGSVQVTLKLHLLEPHPRTSETDTPEVGAVRRDNRPVDIRIGLADSPNAVNRERVIVQGDK